MEVGHPNNMMNNLRVDPDSKRAEGDKGTTSEEFCLYVVCCNKYLWKSQEYARSTGLKPVVRFFDAIPSGSDER